jgi:hypothetical protein
MAQIGIYSEQLFFLILKNHPRNWHFPEDFDFSFQPFVDKRNIAIFDRMIHHSVVIQINGLSHQAKDLKTK